MANDFQGDLGLGRMVQGQREKLGLSRQELAERTGLSYNMIAKIELGRRMIPSKKFDVLASELKVGVDQLYAASGMLPPDIQSRIRDATPKQLRAIRRTMHA